jgi:hypothetical protein
MQKHFVPYTYRTTEISVSIFQTLSSDLSFAKPTKAQWCGNV